VTESEFKKTYWSYYLILENDLLSIEPYVALHSGNYHCFSNVFIKYYQAICSEVDVICRKYSEYIKEEKRLDGLIKDISDYQRIICSHKPEIVNYTLHLLDDEECSITPWQSWSSGAPTWWKKYNSIKHNRSEKNERGFYNYQYANLENVLNSLAALYIIEKYFYTDLIASVTEVGKIPNYNLRPRSKLFDTSDVERTWADIFKCSI
jgi:hypothetical protein